MRPVAASLLSMCLWLLPVAGAARAAEEAAASGVQGDVDVAAENDDDPWERMNRKVFAFNEGLDRWVLEPAATGWDKLVPEPAQRSIGNFFANIRASGNGSDYAGNVPTGYGDGGGNVSF